MHTHLYTCTLTYTHAHSPMHMHTHLYTCTLTCTHAHSPVHMHASPSQQCGAVPMTPKPKANEWGRTFSAAFDDATDSLIRYVDPLAPNIEEE